MNVLRENITVPKCVKTTWGVTPAPACLATHLLRIDFLVKVTKENVYIRTLLNSNVFAYTFKLDINECLAIGRNCSHRCVNSKGSYECSCFKGYTLNVDNFTCTGECK